MVIVEPESVTARHQNGFRLFRAWQSCLRKGKLEVQAEVHDLKAKMSLANPVEINPPRLIDTPRASYAQHG
jgi:hypothetical protein